MKIKNYKFNKKQILNTVLNPDFKIIVNQNFSYIKFCLICYQKLNNLLDIQIESDSFLKKIIQKIEFYFLEEQTIIEIDNDFKKNIIENYLAFFALDLKIIKNNQNIDLIYEINKIQIKLFLDAKKIIIDCLPSKLNIIIETFNKFRKPIHEHIKIN